MTKHTIYRIENKDGVGMYYVGADVAWNMQTGEKHPGPWQDSQLAQQMVNHLSFDWHEMDRRYKFGFASVDQLRSWIYEDEWLKRLHDEGMLLAIIEVDDYAIGHTQAVFIRPASYQTISIAEYFDL